MDAMSEHDSRTRLLEATLKVVRAKGYAAARVEDVCAEAGLTKGSFFHHFKSKDDLGVAAAVLWGARADALFAAAGYHRLADPKARLLAYVEFRKSLLSDDFTDFTCFAGDIVQEAYVTHPEVSGAAAATILGHAATLEADVAEAMALYGVTGFSARSLARHTQGVLQGAFILAKATGDVSAAAESLNHLGRYLELLFASRGEA
jgi:TetR/AcrR family transcriptional regulator, transcriptional repressor for nem operon